MKTLEAHEVSLTKVFSSDYEFVIPDYQRPYTWGAEQAAQLLDDLGEAMERDPDDPYFLGSIVVVKQPNVPEAQVIDGQQRLTTLTILLAVLRELCDDDPAATAGLDKMIWEPGDTILDLASRPRIRLRPRDEDFFRKHVQDRGGLAVLDTGVAPANDAQTHIVANTQELRRLLAVKSAGERLSLAKTIAQRTYLVVVSTVDLASAYRIFSVMNARGVELMPADIFKAKVIGALPHAEQQKYADRWENLEADLGREAFSDLFSQIRMVYMKVRAREQLLLEFDQHVLAEFLPGSPADFVDSVLELYGRAYRDILNCDYQSVPNSLEINRWLHRLHRLDNFDWQAPVLWAFTKHRFDTPWLVSFLARLDRLCAWMLIRRYNTHGRGQRIGQLLRELGAGLGLDSPALELTLEEQTEMLERLQGEIYRQATIRKYILFRLNEVLSDPPVFDHDPKIVTVEHVLPQNPPPASEWSRLFTAEQRAYWTHRLANLVLLSRTKNSAAQNYDFVKKKVEYFTSKSGVANFALTTQVLANDTWTPQALQQRQRALVASLADAWKLAPRADL